MRPNLLPFLRLLAPILQAQKIEFYYLDGQTNKRQEIVDYFNNSPGVRIFLIGLRAGGVGLNLTAANISYVFDPWWNRAVEKQAIDRIHRIGQQKEVFVYKIISRHTVEEKVLDLHQRKMRYMDEMAFS